MGEVTAFIGLGSNLGERAQNISKAIDLLGQTADVKVSRVSTVLETDPIGKTDQPKFLNCVAQIQTTLLPVDLCQKCLSIEKQMGRERRERWGPRLIDLDVLLYGDEDIEEPGLTVPHPEIPNRPFVQDGLRELGAYG